MNDQGDVALFQTLNGGDINVTDGIIAMSGGLESSVYLSMFGGTADWWGNQGEPSERQYVSQTEKLLQSIPLTSGNLNRIEIAVLLDLAFLLDLKIASTVEVDVTIPAPNTVNINIIISAEGKESEFNFTENWKASIADTIQGGVESVGLIAVPSTYSQITLSRMPIAYWKLDEPDTATVVVDSIAGNNGVRVGNITLGVPGLIPTEPETALELPGNYTDRIDLADVAALRPVNFVTIELLVNISLTTQNYAFHMWAGDTTNGSGFGITFISETSRSIRFYLATVGGSNSNSSPNGWLHAPNVMPLTGPHLVHCTYDGATRRLYADGFEVFSTAKAGAIKYGPVNGIAEFPYIGAHRFEGIVNIVGKYDGVIQHVALYDRALTASEILEAHESRG